MSRRNEFYKYYRKPQEEKARLAQELKQNELLKAFYNNRSSASTNQQDRYSFKGEGIKFGVVVRCDLNGYSTWARDKSLNQRAQLLDEFFSWVFQRLEVCKGVYFRDEGDCLVAIFSDYFDSTVLFDDVRNFCTSIIGRTYGADDLTAKAIISCGSLAFYQKNHELGTDDWSAEGEPFVLAARVEQAIESDQRIYFFKKDYDTHFKSVAVNAQPGERYYWNVKTESHQIKGIGKIAGWEEFFVMEYIPGGSWA